MLTNEGRRRKLLDCRSSAGFVEWTMISVESETVSSDLSGGLKWEKKITSSNTELVM